MPRVRAVKSFVWHLRDVDVGEILDVAPREAFLLVEAYKDCEAIDGMPEAPIAMTSGDPFVQHNDPKPKRRR